MEILVSFCNLRATPGRPALGLLDGETLKFRVLQLPGGVPQATGVTGLAVSERYVYAALQTSGGARAPFEPPGLLVFDRADFSLSNHYVFQLTRDVHSLCIAGDGGETLYVVSSGTDEVIELHLRGAEVLSEKVFWRPEPEGARTDVYHINAINEREGEILISGFGKKREGELWNAARDGFIFNVNRGEMITSGIEHPHSLAIIDRRIAYCESRKMLVRIVGDETMTQLLPGYTRGLCTVGEKLLVGTSASRRVSKSTGVRHKPGDLGVQGGECTVSRLSIENFEIEATASLRAYAEEIYDLVPVESAGKWPVIPDDDFRPFDEAWSQLLRLAMKDLAEVVPVSEPLILVDDNQWESGRTLPTAHRRFYFLECDGEYWGVPPDAVMAVNELERMRREAGAGFIAFGCTAFWWLDYYAELHAYLRSNFHCVLDNERLVVFDLRR